MCVFGSGVLQMEGMEGCRCVCEREGRSISFCEEFGLFKTDDREMHTWNTFDPGEPQNSELWPQMQSLPPP